MRDSDLLGKPWKTLVNRYLSFDCPRGQSSRAREVVTGDPIMESGIFARRQKMFQKKGFRNPTKFPAVFHFRAGALNFDILVANESAFVGLKMNARSVDGPALKAIPEGRTTGVTVDQLESVLVAGATWREPRPVLQNEPDGAPMICAYCGDEKQPVKYFFTDKETGETEERGNFMELKAEKLEALRESNPELLVAAEAHTREVIGAEAAMPKFVRTLFVCEDDKKTERSGRDPVFRTYFSRATIVDRLFERNTRIQAAVRRNTLNDLLGSKRKDPRAKRDFEQRYSGGGSSYERRPPRDKKPVADFLGARFEVGTVGAFQRAGITSLEEVVNASNEWLAKIGAISSADHQPAADSVRHRAELVWERSTKADSIAQAAIELSVPLGERSPELEKFRDHKPPASRKTGRKGERFNRKGSDE